MSAPLVHPNEPIRDYYATTLRKLVGVTALWIDQTEPERLDWIPGEPGVTKARSILDQIGELDGIYRRVASQILGDPAPQARPEIVDARTAKKSILESGRALADLLQGLDPARLEDEVETYLGPMPRRRQIDIFVIWNTLYHGGVINAYQLMYGDEEFKLPL